MVDGRVTQNGRLSCDALRAVGRRSMDDSGRAGRLEALCSSVREVLGAFLDAAAWIRDGVKGWSEAGDARKKGASMRGKTTGREQRGQYSQSMTKLPAGWGAGVGSWCVRYGVGV